MGAKKWIRNRNFCCHISDAINLKLKQDVNQFPRKEPRTDLFMNIHEVYRSVRFRIIAMICHDLAWWWGFSSCCLESELCDESFLVAFNCIDDDDERYDARSILSRICINGCEYRGTVKSSTELALCALCIHSMVSLLRDNVAHFEKSWKLWEFITKENRP